MSTKKETVAELLIEKPVSKNSQALEQAVTVLEHKLEQAAIVLKDKEKELLDLKKSNTEITANEFGVRKTLQETETKLSASVKEVEIKNKQIESLKIELNKLANLFDEYITAYKDQTKMLSVAINNTQLVGKHLDIKVDAYNKGETK